MLARDTDLEVTSNMMLSGSATWRTGEQTCVLTAPTLYPAAPAMSVPGPQMGKQIPGYMAGTHWERHSQGCVEAIRQQWSNPNTFI